MRECLKTYCKWIYCCKGKCSEGYEGKCNLPGEKREYPPDGLCYKPEYIPYDDELDELGVFEKI